MAKPEITEHTDTRTLESYAVARGYTYKVTQGSEKTKVVLTNNREGHTFTGEVSTLTVPNAYRSALRSAVVYMLRFEHRNDK